MILAGLITTALASLACGAPAQDLQRCVLLAVVSPQYFLLIISTSIRRIVPGLAFDRYVVIWLENTNFAKAAKDRK